jgi:hypothetical protein
MDVYKTVTFNNYDLSSLLHEIDSYLKDYHLSYWIYSGYLTTKDNEFIFTLYEKLDDYEMRNLSDQ